MRVRREAEWCRKLVCFYKVKCLINTDCNCCASNLETSRCQWKHTTSGVCENPKPTFRITNVAGLALNAQYIYMIFHCSCSLKRRRVIVTTWSDVAVFNEVNKSLIITWLNNSIQQWLLIWCSSIQSSFNQKQCCPLFSLKLYFLKRWHGQLEEKKSCQINNPRRN